MTCTTPLLGSAAFLLGLAACGAGERRFALRSPLLRDSDQVPVFAKCHYEPKPHDPVHVSCAPEVLPNPIIWDGVDNLVFRPMSESLGIVVSGEAVNVNSLDEVPDSAWFTNRIGVRPVFRDELELGACTAKLLLDGATAADGTWVIDKGKEEGSTDGFRVAIPGHGKYLFKADDVDTPEHSSGAQTLGSKVYYAAGYQTTCEQVVYFRPSALKLMPGLTWKHNFGDVKPFGAAELEKILTHLPRRGDLVRMQASAWLSGLSIGGFTFDGKRRDDPNDVVDHADRRELRGKRLLDAWIDRVDERRGNTLDMWITDGLGPPDSSPGHVVHYQTDTSEALGSEWQWPEISRRFGYDYIWDGEQFAGDLVTLGTRVHKWDTVQKRPGKEFFAYFNVEDFVPEEWKNGYPVAAFSRMTERDAAWMARILARFTPDLVEVLARTAEFTDPGNTEYLRQVLQGRLDKILERYLTRLSPIADVHLEGSSEVCGVDLAEWRGLRDGSRFRYQARTLHGSWQRVWRRPGAEVCVELRHVAVDGGLADADPARYVRLRIEDGVAPGPLVVHLYDLGPSRGYRLAGIERPDP